MASDVINWLVLKTQRKYKKNLSCDAFWRDIDQQLSVVKTIYLSVDGVYHNLNINTLQTIEGEYIIDKFKVNTLTNTRFIIDLKQNSTIQFSMATLIGASEFGDLNLVAPYRALSMK